jgi:1,4-dihydroxy-2-naphthoate octaprenyltransferase
VKNQSALQGKLMQPSKNLLSAIKPFQIISLLTTYTLGAGLVQYVQVMQSWLTLIQGLLFLLLISVGLEFLVLLLEVNDQLGSFKNLSIKDKKQRRINSFLISATFFTVAVAIFVDWINKGILWQGFGFLIALLGLSAFLYVLVKIDIISRSYEILFETILFVIIPPAFAYFTQSEDLHRLLTMTVFSLIPAFIAFRLLSKLIAFDRYPKLGRHTLIVNLGWEQIMFIHNALILITFLLYALNAVFGFPWFLLWPVFLTLPIGLLEVWLMERVRRGGKPLWRVMQVATACVYLIPIYLIGFAFWIR